MFSGTICVVTIRSENDFKMNVQLEISNQRSPLSLLRPPLVRRGQSGVLCSKSFEQGLANMKRSISEESFERVILYTHLNQFECN